MINNIDNKEDNTNLCIFDLNKNIYSLLQNETFFASISLYVNKVVNKQIPTAGVWINPNNYQFELLYNPDFFYNLSNIYKIGIIKHEYYHLALNHVTNRRPKDVNDAKLWNIACDLAINSYLENELPHEDKNNKEEFFACFPGEGIFKKYPKFCSAEAYFKKLKEDKNFEQQKITIEKDGSIMVSGKKIGQFDNHDLWIDSPEKEGENNIDVEIIKEKLRNVLKKVIQKTSEQSWGTISENIRKEIFSFVYPKVDWRSILRYFIKTSQRSDKSNSIKKINKRYPYIHSGKKINRVANIAISVDQSGSVGDELLEKFFSELNNLSKIATFTVIPFDTEIAINDVFVWKKGQKNKPLRVKCGGTCFEAPTDYVNERPIFDGHIILTDMCAPKPKLSKCKRMWMTNEQNLQNPYFSTHEQIISID